MEPDYYPISTPRSPSHNPIARKALFCVFASIIAIMSGCHPFAVGMLGFKTQQDGPAIIGLDITSMPGGDEYALGDSITIQVALDQAVTVLGNPGLPIALGENRDGDQVDRVAYYKGGSDTLALTFEYMVFIGDVDDNGISVPAGNLQLNTETTLHHDGMPDQSSHRVALPVTKIVDVDSPSVVREGDRIRAMVGIAPPVPLVPPAQQEHNTYRYESITGGVIVFDSGIGEEPLPDYLVAFVFRNGVDVVGASYTVEPGDNDWVGGCRTVRIAINSVFSDYLVTHPSEVTLRVAQAQDTDGNEANNPATGVPTISGIAQVDETLVAHTNDILDPDGLSDVEYQYQWLRGSGEQYRVVPGASGASYGVTTDDVGNQLRVSIAFTDDLGNAECLTSIATATVLAQEKPPTPTPEPTPTPVPTPTLVPTAVPTPVPTPVPTATPRPTPVPTATPRPTPVPTATPRPTPVPTATPRPTPVPTATPRPTPVPTATPRPTPVPTATPRPTPVPTATPRPTPVPTATPRPTPVPTATPRPTPVPTATPRPTPVPTATPRPTPVPTATPRPTPVPTATPRPTPEPDDDPEPDPKPEPAPTQEPTPAPVIVPTAVPTAVPTVVPTAVPTAAPTVAATTAPTAEPTREVAPTAEPEPGTSDNSPDPTIVPEPTHPLVTIPIAPYKPIPTRTPNIQPSPTPTQVTVVMAQPTALPTPTVEVATPVALAITPTPPADVEDVEPVAPPTLERQSIPIVGDTIPRIRNALVGVASSPRQRITLIILLAAALVIAVSTFLYLVLRRQ